MALDIVIPLGLYTLPSRYTSVPDLIKIFGQDGASSYRRPGDMAYVASDAIRWHRDTWYGPARWIATWSDIQGTEVDVNGNIYQLPVNQFILLNNRACKHRTPNHMTVEEASRRTFIRYIFKPAGEGGPRITPRRVEEFKTNLRQLMEGRK